MLQIMENFKHSPSGIANCISDKYLLRELKVSGNKWLYKLSLHTFNIYLLHSLAIDALKKNYSQIK